MNVFRKYWLPVVVMMSCTLISSSALAQDLYGYVGVRYWSDLDSVFAPFEVDQEGDLYGPVVGVGYAFDEKWSVVAEYAQSPKVSAYEVYPGSNRIRIGESEASIFAVAGANEFPITQYLSGNSISLLTSLGVVQFSQKVRLFGITNSGPFSVEDTTSETGLFASVGLKLTAFDGRIAAVLSYARYFNAVEGHDASIGFDVQGRF